MRAPLTRLTQRRPAPTRRRAHHPSPARPVAVPLETSRTPELRTREEGGPLDRAHYTCACGYAFDAPVSTSVSCPHCGSAQAW